MPKLDFTVLVLPDMTQNFDDTYAWRSIHDAVVGWGGELNIPTFDLLTLFRGEDHNTLLVPWDGHPNAEAHRRMAEFLVARIGVSATGALDGSGEDGDTHGRT